jgi:non-ribosomal peptide synthetase component F
VEIGIRSVFEKPTVEGLSRRIEEAMMAGEEERLAYWKKQLGKMPSALDLPADHPRPLVPSCRVATRSFSLSAELSRSLRALSRQEGVTPFMTLLAAFKTQLYKYSGQKDIIVGTPASNRNRAEIEPLIGCFVDTLPMRTDLSGNPRFRELLRRVKEAALGGYTHQDLPFETVIDKTQPELFVGQMPLFNVAFGRGDLEGLKIRSMMKEQKWARFDLSMWMTEDVDEIQVSWIYSQDLFEEGTVIRMHGHFETLLLSVVDRPDGRLNSINISFEDGAEPTHQEQGDWEDLEAEKPISSRRKGINLST